ncbi:hypothetical protein BG74_02095 [Sodalis-like endosymbiont of Proechinophthirus fluctus]|nr:hypothetical protein BG74_02095 [Sodalis-like endosymbiont of Proechinophthirus fluctus]
MNRIAERGVGQNRIMQLNILKALIWMNRMKIQENFVSVEDDEVNLTEEGEGKEGKRQTNKT